MEPQNTLLTVLDLLNILVFIPALWVARPFQHIAVAQLSQANLKNLVASRSYRLILWLAIGALFASPLYEILGWMNILTTMSQGVEGMGSFNLGRLRLDTFSLLLLLVDLAVFAAIIWLGRDWLERSIQVEALRRELTGVEKWFALLAAASLVNLIVGGFILRILLFYLNHLQTSMSGPVGMLLVWALAVLLAVFVVTIMDVQLSDYELKKKGG